MNFLAHLYLSGDDQDIKVGNFIADAVKGRDWKSYRPGIRKGIMLHRAIDSYTDNHPVVRASIQRLQGSYHKYSGIIVDMLYDHYLAANWSEFHPEPLEDYVDECYSLMLRNHSILPARVKRILSFMMIQNWLVSYADLNALERYYIGMARRTSFLSGMEKAIIDIRANYRDFEFEFREFFPEIKLYVAEWLSIDPSST